MIDEGWILRLSEKERETLLTELFEGIDTNALIESIERHYFATMGERMKKENEYLKQLLGK